MKILRKIFFRIVFLLAVLCCFGINEYSGYNIHPYSAELTDDKNCVVNNIFSDIDFYDDDQLNHTTIFCSFEELRYQIPILRNYFLISEFFFSVWQPPKIF